MPPSQTTATPDTCQDPQRNSRRWSRLDQAKATADFQDPFRPACSQRQYAQRHGIPPSTLADWLKEPVPEGVEPEVAAFFRTPPGQRFLRRQVLAAHLAFRQVGPCGIRTLSLFLRWSCLDCFVGASYGAQQRLAGGVQGLLLNLQAEQQPLLAEGMTAKTIALVPDENFHQGDPCLVAIEPVSNFILVEQYAECRDANTWTTAIQKATTDLKVEVVLVPSDRASALIACARDGLQARHLPELFHGQRDLARPFRAALQRQKQAAQKQLEQAEQLAQAWQKKVAEAQAAKARPGPKADDSWFVGFSRRAAERAARRLKEGEARQERARAAVRGLGDDYHPFDSQTGQAVMAEQMEERLGKRLKELEAIKEEGQLGSKAEEAVAGGRRWLVALVGMVGWFWMLVQERVEEMDLAEEAERAVQEQLLPGLYWQQAARRGRTAEERHGKEELAERLLKEAWSAGGALARLPQEQRREVERVGKELVGLFARSSSCVEGRNGRLSLFGHGQTRLSSNRLKALTVVHNYLVTREDGTTAAERFFGQKHPDAFEWLLERLTELPRPAAKRPKKTAPSSSQPA
jgi:hypothetical protein